MPVYDYEFLLNEDHKAMVNGNCNSQNEVNFGIATPGVADAGNFGAHIVITQAYTAINSGAVMWVCTGASTAPTTKVVGRSLTKTQLGVLNAHYFLPIPPGSLLQYARLKGAIVSENSTLGKMTCWFGPDTDGSI